MWYFHNTATGSFLVYGLNLAFKRPFTDTNIKTLFYLTFVPRCQYRYRKVHLKNFALLSTQCNYYAFPPLVPTLTHIDPVNAILSYFPKTRFPVISTPLSRFSQVFSFLHRRFMLLKQSRSIQEQTKCSSVCLNRSVVP